MIIRSSVTLYEDQYKFFKAFNSEKLLVAFVEYMFEDIEPEWLTDQEQVIFDSLRIRMNNQKKKSYAGQLSHWWWRPKWETKKQHKNNTKTTEKQQEQVQVQEQVKEQEQVIWFSFNKENMCNWTLHDSLSFSKFRSLYPIKKDKKKAKQKYEKMSLIKKQLAIDWISKLKESEQRKKWFIPLPTTYLNWERREDEVENKQVWVEQLKERERKRIQEEARCVLFENSHEHEKPVQNQWIKRRTNFESS